jgi:methionine-rich copper-binding protein CopC
MTTLASRPALRAGLAVLATALAVPTVVGLTPVTSAVLPSAAAHAELESTTPTAGSTLTTAPTRVVLRFGENIKDVGDGVVVTAPDGTRVDTGETVVRGSSATQRLDELTAAGSYTVRYRIVSADGHAVSSSFAFTYRPAPTAGARGSSSEDAVASPAVTAVADRTAAAEDSDAANDGFVWVLGLGAMGAVLIVAVVSFYGRRRRK